MTAEAAPREKRALSYVRSPLVVSAGLFAAIVALRFSAHTPQRAGVLLLLIAPIILMSLAYSLRSGVAVATGALLASLVGQQVDGSSFDAIAAATRAFTYYAIPLTIWLARIDVQRRLAGIAVEEPVAHGELGAKPLTTRELEVLGLVAAGRTNAEIAEILVLSVRTIESHRASLRRKLGHPSQPDLVRLAERHGVLPEVSAGSHPDAVPGSDPPTPGLVY